MNEHVKGQWHGDVDVHIFEDLSRTERKRFWQDITRLMMTRHENIALFMGVCVNPPNFAIVTRNMLKVKGPINLNNAVPQHEINIDNYCRILKIKKKIINSCKSFI
ncbi:unnamed protein product [Schistosoma mattheei]|uniref:Uncharacterized protein n=1 Tax=Schistosoma mattheei TaxID=31246 RepID=A0A183PKW5_9TREM|nr:unnamed protein product [Schistosoma mattheei]